MTALYILFAILIFGVLIGIHEFGHFVAAKLCGVRVLEFSMGMGPLLWHKDTKSGTQVSLRLLPIGGFCAMEGEDGGSDDPAAFSNAAAWKRLIILAAGACMNFLLGFVLVIVCLSQSAAFIPPTITDFMEGCPYESADGLMVGDTFYKINGERIYFSSDVATYLARGRGGGDADIVLIRDGHKIRLNDYPMTLREYTDPDTGEKVMRYGLYFAAQEAGPLATLKYSWYSTLDFVRMVRLGLTDLVTGAASVKEMSGVVGVVDMMAEVGTSSPTVADGILNVVYLAAFIAVNLAVMNLLPIPALDGGRIFFLLVTSIAEKLLGHKIDPKYEGYVNTAGLVLLMGLMVYVMFNDIARIVRTG